MRSLFNNITPVIILTLSLVLCVEAQDRRAAQKGTEPQKSEAKPETEQGDSQQDVETVKINTNLVTVPVIVNDRDGNYMPDLRKDEFTIYEDGVKQEVSFFATVDAPFHVVLMIDTSGSTQAKLRMIQRAAIDFTSELQPEDRLKVISFDDIVRELSDFTNDRMMLQSAIQGTRAGEGTKLYDAMHLALERLRPIKGRKAIVIFTDGVDWHSDDASYEQNRRMIQEAGVIIYPIRYDTRLETERIARRQAEGGQLPNPGGIFGRGGKKSGGTTPPTFPGDSRFPIPGRTSGPMGLPGPVVISQDPGDTTDPRDPRNPRDPRDTRRQRGDDLPMPDASDSDSGYPSSRQNDSITAMLDSAYKLADLYLNDIAVNSGGRLVRADTLSSLPAAFSEIAAELRTQYSLGYYPANTAQDGNYRKIQVKSNRKGAILRARPGYRTPNPNEVLPRRRRRSATP